MSHISKNKVLASPGDHNSNSGGGVRWVGGWVGGWGGVDVAKKGQEIGFCTLVPRPKGIGGGF